MIASDDLKLVVTEVSMHCIARSLHFRHFHICALSEQGTAVLHNVAFMQGSLQLMSCTAQMSYQCVI